MRDLFKNSQNWVLDSLLTIITTTVVGLLCGCTKPNNVVASGEVVASSKIESSFTVVPFAVQTLLTVTDEDLHLDHERILISKSALEKEFLLQVSLIPQPSSAMSSGLKSRVVAFRKRGDKVYMLEATQGHSATHDLPQNLVLAEIPILAEDENTITIDFNKGMANLLVASEWRGSDSDEYNPGREFASVPLHFSYIEKAVLEKNHLIVRQVAQSSTNLPVEVKYYLSPYQPTADFTPTQSLGDFERMGFFQIAPLQRIN